MLKIIMVLMLTLGYLVSGQGDGQVLNTVPGKIHVLDGDTIRVDMAVENCPAVLCKDLDIRITGIDAPEVHTKIAYEKTLGEMSKTLFEDFIKKSTITIHNCFRDKYFRLNCQVQDANGTDWSEYVISKKLAIPYQGEKKVYDWTKHTLN